MIRIILYSYCISDINIEEPGSVQVQNVTIIERQYGSSEVPKLPRRRTVSSSSSASVDSTSDDYADNSDVDEQAEGVREFCLTSTLVIML